VLGVVGQGFDQGVAPWWAGVGLKWLRAAIAIATAAPAGVERVVVQLRARALPGHGSPHHDAL
jgi:hypothetical protein